MTDKISARLRRFLMGAAATFALATPASLAAQTQAAADTANRTVLPMPDPAFTGKIGKTYADSTPAFPKQLTAPKGAPNVFIVMTDDVGFAASSTFGGVIPTPNLDRIADAGLRFARFHTTAMCSPTRAALLTGRNHHAVGNGIVANLTGGYPGYWSEMPRSAATMAEVLKLNGYNTAMLGKHHLGPETMVSAAGPFKDWPTGLGFDYFYGFVAAETNQFTPALYRGIAPIPTLEEGVLDTALADEAIGWVRNQKAGDPDKPFFLYMATGTAHAPHQAPAEWLAKFRGKFDQGWDVLNKETLARQIKLGVVPKDTKPAERPEGIPAWDSLTPDQKKINARFMEAYAAMLAYQDNQFGRVLDELERMGELDNTLIIFIEGDNGSAAEGGLHGSLNPMAGFANGYVETEEELLKALDTIGGPDADPNYGFGWAWLTNTPFPMYKQYASHLGGVRNGMVFSWPKGVKSRGVRTQFTHVTDIMPTVLELVGLPQPTRVNGIDQQPMDGVSFAYTLGDPRAPERKKTQYFEMMGNQGIYHDGWWAGTTPERLPWKAPVDDVLPTDYAWELYDLRKDPAQTNNLAEKMPEKLAELKAVFQQEAEKNNVYPLDDRMKIERFKAAEAGGRPPREHYTYWGSGIVVPVAQSAPIMNRSFRLTAEIDVPEAPFSGAILALGSNFAGWSFYLQDNKPTALAAASQREADTFKVQADKALPAGKAIVTYDFNYDGGVNAGGEVVISVDGQEVGRGQIGKTMSKLVEMTDTMDVGGDASTPVTKDYPLGGRFDGVQRVDIDLGPLGRPGTPPVRN